MGRREGQSLNATHKNETEPDNSKTEPTVPGIQRSRLKSTTWNNVKSNMTTEVKGRPTSPKLQGQEKTRDLPAKPQPGKKQKEGVRKAISTKSFR